MTWQVALLIAAFCGLLYSAISFAHSQTKHAEMENLERMYAAGLLNDVPAGRLVETYKFLDQKLTYLAPAVCLRRELWLRPYSRAIRCLRWMFPCPLFDNEMRHLNAVQARHYWIAMDRYDEYTRA
ncbi:MAG: hypothetical protein ACRD0Y_09380 [Terriglobales bacterium]